MLNWYCYIIYAIAFIFLSYSVYLIIKYYSSFKDGLMNLIKKYNFTRRVYEDFNFRTTTFACSSLITNILFAVFEITMSLVSKSIWYGALGSYHIILSLTRFGIVIKNREINNQISNSQNYQSKKLNLYKNTGICVLIFNLALIGAIAQMMFSRKAFNYIGLMIYVMATYAFWKITVSIIGIIKAKKLNDYGIQSLKNINLTDAIISIYALQTALIATFGDSNSFDMKCMNLASGIAVIGATVAIGVYMIVKCNKEKQKLNEVKAIGTEKI